MEVKRINNVNEITKPFEWAIGGGSTQLYYKGNKGNKGINSSRILSHGVFIKEL